MAAYFMLTKEDTAIVMHKQTESLYSQVASKVTSKCKSSSHEDQAVLNSIPIIYMLKAPNVQTNPVFELKYLCHI